MDRRTFLKLGTAGTVTALQDPPDFESCPNGHWQRPHIMNEEVRACTSCWMLYVLPIKEEEPSA